MGQASAKLWDAVESGDAVVLTEVLTHKEANVNDEKTFKVSPNSPASLFNVPYLSQNPSSSSSSSGNPPPSGPSGSALSLNLSKTPLHTHEKIAGKLLGENCNRDTVTPLHVACEKGRPCPLLSLPTNYRKTKPRASLSFFFSNAEPYLLMLSFIFI